MTSPYFYWFSSASPRSQCSPPPKEKKFDPKDYAHRQRLTELVSIGSWAFVFGTAAVLFERARTGEPSDARTLSLCSIGGLLLGSLFSLNQAKQNRKELMTNLSYDLEGLTDSIETHAETLTDKVEGMSDLCSKIYKLTEWACGYELEEETSSPNLTNSLMRKQLLSALNDLLQKQINGVTSSLEKIDGITNSSEKSKKIVDLWNQDLEELQNQLKERAYERPRDTQSYQIVM